jgi:hypothetical protein
MFKMFRFLCHDGDIRKVTPPSVVWWGVFLGGVNAKRSLHEIEFLVERDIMVTPIADFGSLLAVASLYP